MASKKVDWDRVHRVIESIPKGYWMSYGDVCEAAGMSRNSAKALGLSLSRAKYVPKTIYRVLRSDGGLSAGWKGEIGSSDDCMATLKAEGVTFDKNGLASQKHRYIPPKVASD